MIKRLILIAAALWPVSSASAQVLNWGDYNDQDQTIYFYFNTIDPDTKAPEALTGGAVEVYEEDSTTQITTAETLTTSFDGITGLHQIAIDLSDAGFEAGKTYTVVISAGTVDGLSVAGRMIGVFSVNRFATAVDFETEITDRLPSAAAVTNLNTVFNADFATAYNSTSNMWVTEVAPGTEIEVADADIRAALGMSAADLDSQLDAIVADTGELQTDWVNGGRLDLLIDSIKAATDLLNSAQAEPTGVPAANETPLDKLAYVYMMLRNKITVTSDTKTYFDDGGAAEFKKGLTDDGTTYTEAEAAAP